ncbi:LysR family transcriptional regulator [Tateyamaria sp. SN3-11]|uniref:LysR family transcriptional regulator n=1 Tax=Tateyamaria sp. SN3-11 TaxID=3092147 RepID=UPI0039EB945D
MLHAFCALAESCNLTVAARELATTRQTVRRHLGQLESIRGKSLLVLQNRAYVLTEEGAAVLPIAKQILRDFDGFLYGSSLGSPFLPKRACTGPNGFYYIQERQSTERIWDKTSGLFKHSLQRWSSASGDVEHPSMKPVRERSLVCRMNSGSWICTEVGDLSFYSTWWGWVKARSSVGCNINAFPLGTSVGEILERSYSEVVSGMGFVLDQVATLAPRTGYDGSQPMHFDRLLLGVRFPDKSRGIMIVVDGAETTDIEATGYLPVDPADVVRVEDLD